MHDRSRRTITKRAVLFMSVLLSASVALASCASERARPVDAARAWFEALAALDLSRVNTLTCSPDNQAIENALASSGGLGSTVDLSSLQAQIQIDLSGLNFEEKSADGERAVVRVSGNLGGRHVDQDVSLLNEDGMWKVCTSLE